MVYGAHTFDLSTQKAIDLCVAGQLGVCLSPCLPVFPDTGQSLYMISLALWAYSHAFSKAPSTAMQLCTMQLCAMQLCAMQLCAMQLCTMQLCAMQLC